jgi:hypothetical protein
MEYCIISEIMPILPGYMQYQVEFIVYRLKCIYETELSSFKC